MSVSPSPPSCARPDAPRNCSRADARPLLRRDVVGGRGRGRRQCRHRFLDAAILRGLVLRRNVIQHRRQPAFGLGDAPALARGVVLDLVALDLADAEIEAFGMAEIKPRHRRARPHRIALGQLDAGGVLGIEQREQRRLFGVVGLRGIARRRANAGILLEDQFDRASASRPAHSPRIRGARAHACARQRLRRGDRPAPCTGSRSNRHWRA